LETAGRVVFYVESRTDQELELCKTLRKSLQKTKLLSGELTIDVDEDDNKRENSKLLDRLLASFHEKTEIFIVAVGRAADWLTHAYCMPSCLSQAFRRSGKIAGIILVYPDRKLPETSTALLPSVPTLVLVERTNPVSPNAFCRTFVSSPHQILVTLARLEEKENHVESLWVARLVLKFIGTVINTEPNALTMTVGDSIAKKSSLNGAATLRLGARL
jgi:hypothetical protein